jgi:beta-phosphoglucomutase-like phosphatase (HAD superfamily)
MHTPEQRQPFNFKDTLRVIVDVEGTITDSELEKRLAFVAVVKEFLDLDLPVRDFAWTLGLKRAVIAERLTNEFEHRALNPGINRDTSLSLGDQILRRRDELLPSSSMQVMDGALELLEVLKDNQIPTAIGSSTYEKVGRQMLEAAQVPESFFDAMVWGDHWWVKQQQDPTKRAIFQRAAEELCAPHKVTPGQAGCLLVIGDAHADTQGARANEFASLLIPDRRIWGGSPDELAVKQSTFVANDLVEARQVVLDLLS